MTFSDENVYTTSRTLQDGTLHLYTTHVSTESYRPVYNTNMTFTQNLRQDPKLLGKGWRQSGMPDYGQKASGRPAESQMQNPTTRRTIFTVISLPCYGRSMNSKELSWSTNHIKINHVYWST